MLPVALAGGTWIFIVVVVALFFVVVFGYYTRSGSGISQRPYRRPGEPPEAPSELAHDSTTDVRNWERGTEGHHRRPRPGDEQVLDAQVAEALAAWRAAQRQSAPRLEPPIGSGDRVRGSGGAPIVAIYIDVSSEPCRSAYRLLLEFVEPGRVRVAVRQLPLADVHELSLPAAEALEAAAAQGKFFELLDDLAASGVKDETGSCSSAQRGTSPIPTASSRISRPTVIGSRSWSRFARPPRAALRACPSCTSRASTTTGRSRAMTLGAHCAADRSAQLVRTPPVGFYR